MKIRQLFVLSCIILNIIMIISLNIRFGVDSFTSGDQISFYAKANAISNRNLNINANYFYPDEIDIYPPGIPIYISMIKEVLNVNNYLVDLLIRIFVIMTLFLMIFIISNQINKNYSIIVLGFAFSYLIIIQVINNEMFLFSQYIQIQANLFSQLLIIIQLAMILKIYYSPSQTYAPQIIIGTVLLTHMLVHISDFINNLIILLIFFICLEFFHNKRILYRPTTNLIGILTCILSIDIGMIIYWNSILLSLEHQGSLIKQIDRFIKINESFNNFHFVEFLDVILIIITITLFIIILTRKTRVTESSINDFRYKSLFNYIIILYALYFILIIYFSYSPEYGGIDTTTYILAKSFASYISTLYYVILNILFISGLIFFNNRNSNNVIKIFITIVFLSIIIIYPFSDKFSYSMIIMYQPLIPSLVVLGIVQIYEYKIPRISMCFKNIAIIGVIFLLISTTFASTISRIPIIMESKYYPSYLFYESGNRDEIISSELLNELSSYKQGKFIASPIAQPHIAAITELIPTFGQLTISMKDRENLLEKLYKLTTQYELYNLCKKNDIKYIIITNYDNILENKAWIPYDHEPSIIKEIYLSKYFNMKYQNSYNEVVFETAE